MTRTLVRHCRTEWSGSRFCGRSDPPLSPAGRREAAALAAQFAPSRVPIISSPLQRAQATALEIARRANVAVSCDERLREVDFGDAEGLTFDEIAVALPGVAASLLAPEPRIDWPNGERAVDLAQRVDSFWRDCPADAIVVTHGGVLGHLLRAIADRPDTLPARPAPGTLVRLEGPPWRVVSHWSPPSEGLA